MKFNKTIVLTTALAFGVLAGLPSAYAACSSPAGSEGEQIYNADFQVMQFCDGTDWIAMAGSSGVGGDGSAEFTADGGNIYMTSGNFGLGTNTPTLSLQVGDGTSNTSSILFARPATSTALDVYSSYDAGNDFAALTGAFAYGVLPGSNKFSIQEKGTNVSFTELFGLTTSGDANLAGSLTATGNLSGVNGTFSGTLGATGTSTLGVLNAGATSVSTLGTTGLASLNSASIATTLGVTGTSTLAALNAGATSVSTLGTSGLATLDSLSVTNNASVTGNLGVGAVANSTDQILIQADAGEELSVRLGGRSGQDTGIKLFHGSSEFGYMGYRTSTDSFHFGDTVTADSLVIDRSGSVGIKNSNPSHELDVTGTIRATSFIGDGSGLTNVANATSATNAGNANNADQLDGLDSLQFLRSDAADTTTGTLTIDTGNGDQLTLDNDGSQWTQLNFLNNSTAKTFIAHDDTNKKFVFGAQGAYSDFDSIVFRPDGSSDDVVIQRDGDVGIGKTPGSKLDVNGTVTATAFVGDGSGLTGVGGSDADTLDGIDSADFARTNVATEVFQNRVNLRLMATNNGSELGLAAGESAGHIDTNMGSAENIWLGAEGGVKIVSSSDNWATGWAGRHEASLVNASGNSTFPGTVTATAFVGDGSGLTGVSGSDNLGNHTATTTLAMGAQAISSSAGTIRDANGGWVRTYGNTGWYNGTYQGGWHMQDTTWIRAYNNKSVYIQNALRADNGFQVDAKSVISSNGSVHSAQYPDDTHYGFFEARNHTGDRAFYLGYGDGSSYINWAMEDANEVRISGGHVRINDSYELRLGSSADFRMWHDGSNQRFRSYTHGAQWDLEGENASGTNRQLILADPDNYVYLYYAGTWKFRTESFGIRVQGQVYYASDERLKEDIKPLGNSSLDKLSKITGVSYKWKDKEAHGDQTQFGVIAQDVQKAFPELVRKDSEEDYLTVDYDGLTAPLIEAVKELKAMNEQQQQQISAQQLQINTLTAEIDMLKNNKGVLLKASSK